MAMKCVDIGDILEKPPLMKEAISDLNSNIAEYLIQMATFGSGILLPSAFVRQYELDYEDGKLITHNTNIFVYPRYDCNLYELHKNHFDEFNEKILFNIFRQCLTRNR